MVDTQEHEPLIQPPAGAFPLHQPPPPAERLNRRKVLLVVSGIGLVLAGFFLLRVLRHATAQRTVPPAPLPPVYDVTGTPMPVHKVLDAPASYQDVPRPPRVPLAPVVVQAPPPSPFVQEPRPAPPPPPAVVTSAPVPPPPPPPPPAPAPAVATTPPTPAAPPASTPDPKRWLLSEAKRAEPPFPLSKPDAAPGDPRTTETGTGLVHPATWGKPADPTRVLYRSQAIAGQLLDALNSDIPGQVRIMVTRPVTDRFHQGHVLIPQHSLLLGTQAGKPAFGQTRLAVSIEELHFPDGTIVRLQGGLADRSGALGVRGKVNNHYVKLGIGALLSAALNIGTRGPFGNTTGFQPTLPQEYARDVGSNFSQVGQSIVDRSLNIPPTITLKAGTPVTIQLTENVSFNNPPTIVR